MNRVTKAKTQEDEYQCAEISESDPSSGQEDSSSCSDESGPARDEYDGDENGLIARLNQKIARAKATFRAKKAGNRKAKTPCKKVIQQQPETTSSDNTTGISDKNQNSKKRTGNQTTQRKRKHPKATWTVDKINNLIDLLEERTCLWDIFSQTYHNREKKQIAYNEIGDALDISVEEVKAKVMNLRTQLGRELAKVKEKSLVKAHQIYTSQPGLTGKDYSSCAQ